MSRLFISCISDSATERDLYGLFAGFGRLASFDLKKGFGFVHYAHTADADKARKELDKLPFFGRPLKVERGRNQDASPPRGADENGLNILCFRCKREGHRARDCLVLKQNARPRRRTRSRSRERGADRARPRDRRSPSPARHRRSPEPRRGPRDDRKEDRHEEREEGEMIEAASSDAHPPPADSAEPARDRTATAMTVDPLAHVDDEDDDGERDFRRAFEDTDGSDAEQGEKEDRHWRRASDNNDSSSRARKAMTEESDARRRPVDRRSRERERPQRDGSGRELARRGDRDNRAVEPAKPREREREADERERERRLREAERERERERERARERDRRQRELEELRRREGSANGAARRVPAPDRPPLRSSRTAERERERERERGLKRKERSPPPARDIEPRGSSRHVREEEQPQKHRRTSSSDNGQQKQQPSEKPLSPLEDLLAVPSSPVAHSPMRDADEPRGTRRDRERDDRRSRP